MRDSEYEEGLRRYDGGGNDEKEERALAEGLLAAYPELGEREGESGRR